MASQTLEHRPPARGPNSHPATPLPRLRTPGEQQLGALQRRANASPRVATLTQLRAKLHARAGQPVIQRKITLERAPDDAEDQYRQTNLDDLNRMLAGSQASLAFDPESGELHFNHDEGADVDVGHQGYRLLNRMIASDHEVRVQRSDDPGNAKTRADDKDSAGAVGVGSGSVVRMPDAVAVESLVAHDGELLREQTQRHFVLAHELVHADRAQRGYRVSSGFAEHPVEGVYVPDQSDPFGFALPEGALNRPRQEEGETVGLVAGADPDSITENDLREQLGASRRAVYEADINGFMDNVLDGVTETVRPRYQHIEELGLFDEISANDARVRAKINKRRRDGLKTYKSR